MNKRRIFITLSMVVTLLPLTILFFHPWSPVFVLIPLLEVMIFVVMQMGFIISIHAQKGGSLPDLLDYHFPMTGLLTLRMKRIYFAKLGYFYVRINNNVDKNQKVSIYEQNILYMKYIDHVWYNGDLESMKNEIKDTLESHYKEDIKAKQKINELKNWSGNLDIQSERDDKIKKILN